MVNSEWSMVNGQLNDGNKELIIKIQEDQIDNKT